MLEEFLIAFGLAFISEIVDKTQLVILGLALKYKAVFKVFLGALIAHAVMDGIAILIGSYFGFSLPFNLIKFVVGILFILLGVWTFAKMYIKKEKKEKKFKYKSVFLVSFLVVLLSEFGDKTQIASGLLAAQYMVPLAIFLGFVLALAIVIGLNVFIGSKIAEKLPIKTIKIVTAVLFVLFGLFSLLS